jgi:ribonuclease HII
VRYYERKALKRGFRIIAGIDEAGRGPLAGPVVAACVILDGGRRYSRLIRDSKTLTPKKRLQAYKEIKDSSLSGVGIVDEKTIDRVNIYQATILAMEEALGKLERRPDFALIDGGLRLNIGCPYQGIKGGDAKSVSIAAASIIAKVTRDEIMHRYDAIYPEYGFSRHKGYGTKEHFKALKKFGPSPIHRISFGPCAR